MYGYIRQGRRTALTRETIGGVPFWVLTAGQGLLRRRGVRRLLRQMARCGVKTAVFEDDAWQAAAAKYGIRPPPVQALRLCKLGELLDCVCPRGLRGQAVRLHTGEDHNKKDYHSSLSTARFFLQYHQKNGHPPR